MTPWTAAHQAPLSPRFSRQEYWSGFPFPSPGDPPGEGCNLCLQHWQTDSLPLSPLGSPLYTRGECFFRGSYEGNAGNGKYSKHFVCVCHGMWLSGCARACGIWVSWPGIESVPPGLEAGSLIHWATKSHLRISKQKEFNPGVEKPKKGWWKNPEPEAFKAVTSLEIEGYGKGGCFKSLGNQGHSPWWTLPGELKLWRRMLKGDLEMPQEADSGKSKPRLLLNSGLPLVPPTG